MNIYFKVQDIFIFNYLCEDFPLVIFMKILTLLNNYYEGTNFGRVISVKIPVNGCKIDLHWSLNIHMDTLTITKSFTHQDCRVNTKCFKSLIISFLIE